ncbi:MAG: hypothetical protein L3J92_04155 [Thermoplasmata archaeon]|jgi:uncharacterized OB-fold protein|nr:hypothetical protein [Thermoplasmata archaeon]
MTIGFERGAIYRPPFTWEGGPTLGPDEDAFTMAVGAIEALPGRSEPPLTPRVHLVGDFPTLLEWALPEYLGRPVEISRHAGGAPGLLSALQEAASAEGDLPYLVLAVDLGGPQGPRAAALEFGPNPAPHPPEWTSVIGIEGAAALAGDVLTRAGAVPKRVGPEAGPPWAVDRAASFSQTPAAQVSEGAYVPRARYLENLSSRWRLEADRCGACEHSTFPRRGACRYCGRSDRLSTTTLPRDGARVVAATVLAKGGQPTEFDPQVEALGPYGVVLAELVPGVRLTLQVSDARPGEVRIGDSVGTRLRRLYPMEGEWRYGRKAVPMRA